MQLTFPAGATIKQHDNYQAESQRTVPKNTRKSTFGLIWFYDFQLLPRILILTAFLGNLQDS